MDHPTLTLHFKGDLKDFLKPGNHSSGRVIFPLDRKASIKDIIEGLGPPHVLVETITSDGRQVDFSHIPKPGEELAVFPVKAPMDVFKPTLLRPNPLREIRFLADVNVGKLSTLLRALGFDTLYERQMSDEQAAEKAAADKRIILTKDRNLLKRAIIEHAYLVRVENPQEQLRNVLRFFNLRPPYAVFTRCLRCNTLLRPVEKSAIIHKLQPLTIKYHHVFHICPDCERVYWPGSHHEQLLNRIKGLADF